MRASAFLLIFSFFFLGAKAKENNSLMDSLKHTSSYSLDGKSNFIILISDSATNYTEKHSHKKVWHENKKLISAILAFPFPFGILGLHRIYLGTKPYMPFVYIGTIGGCFGILPLIDFITILTSGDEKFKSFESNSKVFMWSH